MNNVILNGDCIEKLKELDDNSIDSVVTDPPYGLSKEPDITEVLTKWISGEDYEHRGGGFMGKSWDSFVPGPSVWREVFRVLKPGGHVLCFAGTRTQDLMTVSLRLAGFEVRDVVEWLYFSGFPKSYNVGKRNNKWDGWGTALKPAHEPIILCRKPLAGTVCDNLERHGTGAVNVDRCRVLTEDTLARPGGEKGGGSFRFGGLSTLDELREVAEQGGKTPNGETASFVYQRAIKFYRSDRTAEPPGRFPANCITTEPDMFYSKYFNVTPQELSKKASKKDRNSDWRGEPIELEPKDARTYGEYQGVQGNKQQTTNKYTKRANNHPTVKPIDLMAWLCRLITPPGGTVLDPFAGSGSTLVAAKHEGFSFVGIEREAEYVEIARARVGEGEASGAEGEG